MISAQEKAWTNAGAEAVDQHRPALPQREQLQLTDSDTLRAEPSRCETTKKNGWFLGFTYVVLHWVEHDSEITV